MSASRDAVRCGIAATVLVVTASALIFGVRMGESFEGAIAWMFLFLPGALPGNMAAQELWSHGHAVASFVGFCVTFSLSLVWYFILCFGALKGWRRLAR